MAHLIGAEHISQSFPTKDVFDDVTLGLQDGQRIGIVGRNGDGKTTLLRILAGIMPPDSGRVTSRNGLQVGVLDQTPAFDPEQSVADAIVGDLPEHEWASQSRVRDILRGLLCGIDWRAKLGQLSGGQRRRVALAALLRQDWDVLFLDEPTNHLDVEGIAWLAEHLKNRWAKNSGGLVMVTHDRWFLDAVCTDTWEVHDKIVEPFEGGYAAYVLQRVERDRQAAVTEQKRQNLVRKELAWLRRGAPARTSKPKFRIDAANTLIANEPPVRDAIKLKTVATTRLGKDVIDVLDVSAQYDSQPILAGVQWLIGPGDRFGLLGANGAGKTSLLDLVRKAAVTAGSTSAAQLSTDGVEVTTGRIKIGKTVKLATLTQELNELRAVAGDRVREVVGRLKTTYQLGDEELTPNQLLQRLGFETAQLSTPVKDLSGGQKRRLQLMLILLEQPNVLILDEPTNDLDTDMLTALEDVLDAWAGTLIVVSHDRYFLERVVDDFYGIHDTKLRHLPGGVDEFLKLEQDSATAAIAQPSTSPSAQQPKQSNQAGSSTSRDAPSGAQLRASQKQLSAIERKLDKAQTELSELDAKLASADQTDFEKLSELDSHRRKLSANITDLEEQWLELSEAMG